MKELTPGEKPKGQLGPGQPEVTTLRYLRPLKCGCCGERFTTEGMLRDHKTHDHFSD